MRLLINRGMIPMVSPRRAIPRGHVGPQPLDYGNILKKTNSPGTSPGLDRRGDLVADRSRPGAETTFANGAVFVGWARPTVRGLEGRAHPTKTRSHPWIRGADFCAGPKPSSPPL